MSLTKVPISMISTAALQEFIKEVADLEAEVASLKGEQ